MSENRARIHELRRSLAVTGTVNVTVPLLVPATNTGWYSPAAWALMLVAAAAVGGVSVAGRRRLGRLPDDAGRAAVDRTGRRALFGMAAATLLLVAVVAGAALGRIAAVAGIS